MGKEDEIILVLPRELVVPSPWSGIKSIDSDSFTQLIIEKGLFKRRGDIEEDPSWKQIIPYMVFNFENRYFLMQRTDKADERLRNMYSLGIGGHVNKSDLNGSDLIEWAKREFEEEVDYHGNFTPQPLGLLNDESNLVGQVHLGYLILLRGDSEQITIRDEHQQGNLLKLGEIRTRYPQMETWSQLAFDYLIKKD